MKALVKTKAGVGNIELLNVPDPVPAPDQVKIEVVVGAICGTDIHIHDDEYPNSPPFVLGHEMSGVVVSVGNRVSSFKVGDRVSSESFKYTCGECRYCQSGLIGLCVKRRSMGVHVDGAFATYVCQREKSVHALPGNIDFEAGSMCEPMAVAVHAVYERARVTPGDVVMVSGPGTVGLLCVQAARSLGASVVLAGVEGDEERLELGKALGAELIIHVPGDSFDQLSEMTSGLGADIAIECGGSSASLQQCIEQARKGAQLVLVGLYGTDVKVCLDTAIIKEQTLISSFTYGHGTWERMLGLLEEEKIETRPLVSGRFPLSEWEQAFAMVRSRRGHKYLLFPE